MVEHQVKGKEKTADQKMDGRIVGWGLTKPTTSSQPHTKPHSFWLLSLATLVLTFLTSAEAAFIGFENCLSSAIIKSRNPQQLQFVPFFVDARFQLNDPRHTLNLTVYGNVTGQQNYGIYPPPDDPSWDDPASSFGKIVTSSPNYTTLFTTYSLLSYTPYIAQPAIFCNQTVDGSCPWGPLFFANASDPRQLHAFSVSHEFDSTYAFSTLIPNLRIKAGDQAAQFLACISAPVTPYLGDSLCAALRYVPLVILILVAVATIAAARLSPWSSSDFFYWTSNYGRDEDILRLVTPGFGDCLQYIQFIVLAGSLSLKYPGYYQPVVSRAAWSTLMFNESFVSHSPGTQVIQDGIYNTNGTYGLTRMSQLNGLGDDIDVWAGLAVWLCVIIGAVVLLCQIGFASSWCFKRLSHIPQEDLRNKNLPFTVGNVIRIVYNYFLLPIVSFTMFQLVLASQSPAVVTAMAVIGLVILLVFAAWIFFFIFTTKPRTRLFDHLPTLLFYGPLYNTYSDEAAPFSFIPALLTLFRGVAIGAVQPSGIAQIVILAICEIIFILTVHTFRPFQSLTSMNAYHTFFAVVKLITLLLSIAFAPSLNVSEGTRGWIGYAILLLHGIVLVFGFFMNAIQTLIEVFARRSGAGNSEARGGLTKVFGVRQLSKREKNDKTTRASLGSDAAVLTRANTKTTSVLSRSRSQSASSKMMLDEGKSAAAKHRSSSIFEQMSQAEMSLSHFSQSPGPSTPGGGAMSPLSFVGGGRKGTHVAKAGDAPTDPYYRPPRARRPTLEMLMADQAAGRSENASYNAGEYGAAGLEEPGNRSSFMSLNRGSLLAPFTRHLREEPDPALADRRNPTDYSTRESDYYYGLRGPALSNQPSRRRKTGPADPMSPVASATGWFRNIFGGNRRVKGKGFEVVRSTPLHLLPMEEEEEPQQGDELYLDHPSNRQGALSAAPGAERMQGNGGTSRYILNHDEKRLHETGSLAGSRSYRTHSNASHMDLEYPAAVAQSSSTPPPDGVPRRSSKRFSAENPPPVPVSSKPRLSDLRQASFRRTIELSPIEAAASRIPFNSDEQDHDDHDGEDWDNEEHLPDHRPVSPLEPEEMLREVEEAESRRVSADILGGNDRLMQPSPSFMAQHIQRPLSTGRVAQHTASESIHGPGIPEGRGRGSAAEIFGVSNEER